MTVSDVRTFWDANPCGSSLSVRSDRLGYFEEIERKRYEREWHIPLVARFSEFPGSRVLEIGCGIGTDGVQFARHGAEYVGVDLSPVSVELAREQFDLLGLPGTIEVADAEGLRFEDGQFDHVYTFGVIHHSPHVESIVAEIHRVLRPGGTATVMVYNRSSVNFRLEISVLRKAIRPLLHPPFMPRLLSALTGFDREKLERHRELMLARRGGSEADWVSMNTDGPDCPLARVYDGMEAERLFSSFLRIEQEVWYFNRDHWPLIGRLLPHAACCWVVPALGMAPSRPRRQSHVSADSPRGLRAQRWRVSVASQRCEAANSPRMLQANMLFECGVRAIFEQGRIVMVVGLTHRLPSACCDSRQPMVQNLGASRGQSVCPVWAQ